MNTTVLYRPPPLTRHVRVASTAVTEHVWPPGVRDALATAPWRRVVGIGDSIVTGIGDPSPGFPNRSWFDQLIDALATPAPVDSLNLAVIGARSEEIWNEQVPAAVEFSPDLAIVSAGGNDVLGRRFHSDEVEERIERIVGTLADHGARVVTFSLFDLSITPFVPEELRAGLRDRIRQHAAIAERVSESHGGIHVDFSRDPRSGDAALYSADRLHPNRRGQALVFSAMVHALAEAIR